MATIFSRAILFNYLSPEQRVPQDHPLRRLRPWVEAALKQMSGLFTTIYSELGRPSIPPEKLLRAFLFQAFFSIVSERLLMEQLNYNVVRKLPPKTRKLVLDACLRLPWNHVGGNNPLDHGMLATAV